jgi:hypothetical protein
MTTHYFVSNLAACYITFDGQEYGKYFCFERRKLIGTSYNLDPDDTTGQICNREELKKKIHLLDKNIPIIAHFYERPMKLMQCGIAHSDLIRYIDLPHASYYQDFV